LLGWASLGGGGGGRLLFGRLYIGNTRSRRDVRPPPPPALVGMLLLQAGRATSVPALVRGVASDMLFRVEDRGGPLPRGGLRRGFRGSQMEQAGKSVPCDPCALFGVAIDGVVGLRAFSVVDDRCVWLAGCGGAVSTSSLLWSFAAVWQRNLLCVVCWVGSGSAR